jgi:hypothetical protein
LVGVINVINFSFRKKEGRFIDIHFMPIIRTNCLKHMFSKLKKNYQKTMKKMCAVSDILQKYNTELQKKSK